MKKLTLFLTLLVAAALVPAGAATAAKPKKPKSPVYSINGGYDLTSVIYTSCSPGSGGVINETTRVKRHFDYSGDTKRGFTVKETQQEFLIRESTNEFVPSSTITGEPSSRTSRIKGSDAISVKKNRGTFSFDGIGAGDQRQSFRAPKDRGDAQQIKLSTSERVNHAPGVACQVSYEDTSVSGAVLIRRIQ